MENSKVVEEINNLLQLTTNRKINWVMQQPNNPSALKWDRSVDNRNFTITIQKQAAPAAPAVRNAYGAIVQPPQPQSFFYFFTIVKMTPIPQEILLQINSQIEPQYKTILENIYNQALESTKEASVRILSDLLKGL